jgi:hypothetical protein
MREGKNERKVEMEKGRKRECEKERLREIEIVIGMDIKITRGGGETLQVCQIEREIVGGRSGELKTAL